MQQEDHTPYQNAQPGTSQDQSEEARRFLNNPRFNFRKELLWDENLDVAAQPTVRLSKITLDPDSRYYKQLDEELEGKLDTSRMSSMKLMQLSSILRAVHAPQQEADTDKEKAAASGQWIDDSRYVDPQILLEKTRPIVAVVVEEKPEQSTPISPLKAFVGKPIVKVALGAIVGIGMLYLVSRIVNIPTTIAVLRNNLTTPQGISYALLAALSFVGAFSIRGTRWRTFLRPIIKVPLLKAIQIYWVGVFINVLLPVQGGEVAKSIMLKRVTNVPVSQSLPTVAMDKSLDLMPALIIMAIVPFLPGIHMSITLWLILGLVSSILVGLIIVVALTAWNRAFATALIQKLLHILPGNIGTKIEGFAMGFVDSLLAGASQPKVFIPAIFLTCLAIGCDGLFAMFSFWTVGLHMNYAAAIFGYTVFNMFTILPTPPGQVGSNEIIGTLVFGTLLGFNKTGVLAMFVFSHPLTALIMALMCIISLAGLGLKISSALKAQPSDENKKSVRVLDPAAEKQMATV